jgi:4'-phosphopantetheinyl transferase
MIHVWLADLRTLDNDKLNEQYLEWLDEEEKARLEKRTDPERRHQQLLARAMVRWCLSQYSDSTPPHKWQIERDKKGKLHLVDSHLPLSFSLSHSGSWLAVAVTTNTLIGIDIEDKSRKADWQSIARRYFTPDEIANLEKAPENNRRERFFALWTLKEAYFKAHGGGISTGLDKVSFQIDNNGSISAEFADVLEDSAKAWQFHHYQLGEDYCLSLALKQPHAQDAETHFYKTIPGDKTFSLELEAHRVILH